MLREAFLPDYYCSICILEIHPLDQDIGDDLSSFIGNDHVKYSVMSRELKWPSVSSFNHVAMSTMTQFGSETLSSPARSDNVSDNV